MTEKHAKRDFVVSIHPVYVEQIVKGNKTVELRRRFSADVEPGSSLLIYCTSPTKAIVGSAKINSVELLPIRKLWETHGRKACIAKKDFDRYFSGLKVGYAILLGDVRPFAKSIGAAILKKQFGFSPPQSFMYLPEEYQHLLAHE